MNPFLCPLASDKTGGEFPDVGVMQGYIPSNEGLLEFPILRHYLSRSAISIPNLPPDFL